MRIETCAVIVLASGFSKRFGPEDKLLADLDGKPVLRHVFDYLADLNFAARYAVIADSGVSALARDAGYVCVRNTDQALGHTHARALGAAQVIADGFDAALIVLGDMPYVEPAHIQALLCKAKKTDRVMSQSGGVMMPPAYFSGKALSSLIEPAAVKKPGSEWGCVATCNLTKEQARDIDTPEDIRRH